MSGTLLTGGYIYSAYDSLSNQANGNVFAYPNNGSSSTGFFATNNLFPANNQTTGFQNITTTGNGDNGLTTTEKYGIFMYLLDSSGHIVTDASGQSLAVQYVPAITGNTLYNTTLNGIQNTDIFNLVTLPIQISKTVGTTKLLFTNSMNLPNASGQIVPYANNTVYVEFVYTPPNVNTPQNVTMDNTGGLSFPSSLLSLTDSDTGYSCNIIDDSAGESPFCNSAFYPKISPSPFVGYINFYLN